MGINSRGVLQTGKAFLFRERDQAAIDEETSGVIERYWVRYTNDDHSAAPVTDPQAAIIKSTDYGYGREVN
jgi:hypothetical protein